MKSIVVNCIKSLFRAELASKLEPIADIECVKIAEEGKRWLSVSENPCFAIRRGGFLPGWYMLELELNYDKAGADATLFIDAGQNYKGATTISLPLRNGKIAKRLLYFPERIKSIRLSPMEASGPFSVEHFRIVRLASWFARDRLAQRLSSMHPEFRGLSKSKVLAKLEYKKKGLGLSWHQFALERYGETFIRRRHDRDYQQWIDRVEDQYQVSATDRKENSTQSGPLISILLPTYNSNISMLKACIDSVLAQTYSNWQLCIADDRSTDPEIWDCLLSYQAQDSRIQLILRDKNGHISVASNSALELAKGEFVTFLDHDDTLSPVALEKVCDAISLNPQVSLVYSDEDKIDEAGLRFDPHFKPSWNPDLLLSQNYISHLAVIRLELVRKLGGFRLGVEGSQDHDLLMRCLPYFNEDNVVHIPKILYHWRAVDGSTAQDGANKEYTEHAGLRAINDYIHSTGLDAEAGLGSVPNSYRVRWALPKPEPMVSLLIPTRDGFDILKPCVDAILSKTDYPNFELLILDNQSRCDKTLQYFKEVSSDHRVKIHQWNHPFNYSSINNFGAEIAVGEVLGLINNDIEPINGDWLREMVSHALRPEIGCVGAKLYYPNNTIQHGGVILGIGGVAGHAHKYFHRNEYGYFSRLQLVQNLSAVTGACLFLRKSIFEKVGGLEEKHLAVAFNDVDLCLKVREAGYQNLWTPYAELYHHESVSRGADNTLTKRRRAQREADYLRSRWGNLLDSDPAYNPNLTLVHEDFSLASV
ncbi:glycosyltransferase family 2 protein [Microbulbifer sp. ZKSA004]|uniref:glycosyltransferase family 2 protein n=1 Tax=Microbulbifer sp. ZKSA004 TaxID=3243389 RepID=UPI00403A55C7